MAGQEKGETAVESSAKDKSKETFELGVKVVDDNVKKIDKGIRRISKELHKVADAVKKQ